MGDVASPGSSGSSGSGSYSGSEGNGRRHKLEQYNTVQNAVDLLRSAKKILVLSGAGISTSCGIPDFRGRNGIYAQLEASGEFQLDEPSDMFDIEVFRERPQVFYSFAKQIYPGSYEPSPSHRWIRSLEERGVLLRQYTQNIDGLDVKANIKRVLQCHGSFDTASCIRCSTQYPGSDIESNILNSTIPPCPRCQAQRTIDEAARQRASFKSKKKRKWTDNDESSEDEDDPWDSGPPPILKPDITFFGENVFAKCPSFGKSVMQDREDVDLVLVMGTSLKVAPVADILQVIPPNVPQILINMTPILHFEVDIMLLGESDKIVRWLSSQLQWGGEDASKEGEKDDELVWRSGTQEFSHIHLLGSATDTANSILTIEFDDETEEEHVEYEEEANAMMGSVKEKVEDQGVLAPASLDLQSLVDGENKAESHIDSQSSPIIPVEEKYS